MSEISNNIEGKDISVCVSNKRPIQTELLWINNKWVEEHEEVKDVFGHVAKAPIAIKACGEGPNILRNQGDASSTHNKKLPLHGLLERCVKVPIKSLWVTESI